MAQNKSFAEQLTELEQIVSQLEQGDVPLEEALSEFQTGIKLTKDLTNTLQQAEKMMIKVVNEQNEISDFPENNGTSEEISNDGE